MIIAKGAGYDKESVASINEFAKLATSVAHILHKETLTKRRSFNYTATSIISKLILSKLIYLHLYECAIGKIFTRLSVFSSSFFSFISHFVQHFKACLHYKYFNSNGGVIFLSIPRDKKIAVPHGLAVSRLKNLFGVVNITRIAGINYMEDSNTLKETTFYELIGLVLTEPQVIKVQSEDEAIKNEAIEIGVVENGVRGVEGKEELRFTMLVREICRNKERPYLQLNDEFVKKEIVIDRADMLAVAKHIVKRGVKISVQGIWQGREIANLCQIDITEITAIDNEIIYR